MSELFWDRKCKKYEIVQQNLDFISMSKHSVHSFMIKDIKILQLKCDCNETFCDPLKYTIKTSVKK